MSETAALKHRTAWLSIFSNTTLVVLKLIVGLYVGAVSLISEALHSGTDLIAALIAFWAVRKSDAPPDLEHDYGHGKYENLSAAVEALLIVGAAIGIVYEAVNKFATGEVPETLSYGIAIMIVAIVVNFAVSRRLLYVAKITGSQALEADGLHLTADIWTSVGVLIGLLLMQLTGWAWLDPVIAIFVAGIIFRAGWRMVVESTRELTDESLPAEDEARIGAIFDEIPEVRGWHCLRTRKSGSYKLLDVHILFDGNMHLARVHAVCDEIVTRLRCFVKQLRQILDNQRSDRGLQLCGNRLFDAVKYMIVVLIGACKIILHGIQIGAHQAFQQRTGDAGTQLSFHAVDQIRTFVITQKPERSGHRTAERFRCICRRHIGKIDITAGIIGFRKSRVRLCDCLILSEVQNGSDSGFFSGLIGKGIPPEGRINRAG